MNPEQTAFDGSFVPSYATIGAKAPLPANYLRGGDGQGSNSSNIVWNYTFSPLSYTNNSAIEAYCGRLLDLHVGPFSDNYDDQEYGEISPITQEANPPGCPSLVFAFGYFKYCSTCLSNITIATCYKLLQEVQINVTFDMPGLTISTSPPPLTDESTARYLHSGSNGQTAFEFRPQLHFDNELWLNGQGALGTGEEPPASFDQEIPPMDNFFQAVLSGRYPVAAPDLTGPGNQEILISAANAFYSRYMAQAISANMRVASAPSNPQIFRGTTNATENKIRITQGNASKIKLQVMLGVMFICGVLAYSLATMREMLPHEPCSIAAVASLLAGSELCSERMRDFILAQALWMSDKELERQKVWDGWLFSLGYWDWRWGHRSRYGIDIGKEDDE